MPAGKFGPNFGNILFHIMVRFTTNICDVLLRCIIYYSANPCVHVMRVCTCAWVSAGADALAGYPQQVADGVCLTCRLVQLLHSLNVPLHPTPRMLLPSA